MSPAPGRVGASYRTVNTWSGGYQVDVSVTAGSAPITERTVRWTLAAGQTVSQVRNGALSVTTP